MIENIKKLIKNSFLDEVHNLFLFIPVLMGCGAYIYLKYFFNNHSIIPFVISAIFILLSIACKKKHYLNILNIAILSFFLGICSASIETKQSYTGMINDSNITHYVEGHVKKVIPKGKKNSIIIELNQVSLNDLEENMLADIKKVSVSLTSKSEKPNIGDLVYLKANLSSPAPPVMKGAYDFQKDSYFKQIGAIGYAVTRLYFIERVPIHSGIREKLENKIDKTITNENNNKVVKALMLGQKKAIPKEISNSFRASGISHLLSISGLHIGLIFGFIFLLLRCFLATNQKLALNFDIKKIAAVIAIIITLMYVILVGHPIPTIRAFIMIFIIFLGIMFDRRAISMRNVAIAGILIILFSPHSILSASFQMSFSAVIALVSAYDFISRKNINLVGFKGYFLATIFTSIIAIMATAPFAIYNFQNFSPYGLLTNLLVMPIVSFITMPFIVLSFMLLPLGLTYIPLSIVGVSIDWVLKISKYVSNIDASYLLVTPPTNITIYFFVFSGLILCLFKHKLRLLGAIFMIFAILSAFIIKDKPDIIISPNAKVIAARNENGDLTFSNIEKETFISNIMRKINGQDELLSFDNNQFIKCENNNCIYTKENTVIDLNKLSNKKSISQQIYIKNNKILIKNVK